MTCSADEDFQPFPETGRLATNKNLSLICIKDKLSGYDEALLYSYIVASIKLHGSNFVQTGSGPNFQGDLITLCTCKRRMRTALDACNWPGVWIAGLSGKAEMYGLVYLMKVCRAFESQYKLWKWLSPEVRQAKSACLHRLGDVFEPINDNIPPKEQVVPKNYRLPHKYHSHALEEEWHKDISYQGFGGRSHILLVGDPEMSFLWSEPIVQYKRPLHPRTKKWKNLLEFLEQFADWSEEH
jgi:hypothetical protein